MPRSFLTPSSKNWGPLDPTHVRTTPLTDEQADEATDGGATQAEFVRMREEHSLEEARLREEIQHRDVSLNRLREEKRSAETERDLARSEEQRLRQTNEKILSDLRDKSGVLIALHKSAKKVEEQVRRSSDPDEPAAKFFSKALTQLDKEMAKP